MMSLDGLGQAIRLLRVERGLSQADLCEATGIGSSLMSRYESGITRPTLESLRRILDSLDLNFADLDEAMQRVANLAEGKGKEAAGKRPVARPSSQRPRAQTPRPPRAFLVIDLSDGLTDEENERLEGLATGFQSMMRFFLQGPAAAETSRKKDEAAAGAGEEADEPTAIKAGRPG